MIVTHAPILMFQWGPATEFNELESIEDRFAELGPTVLHPLEVANATSIEAYREYVVRERVGYQGDAIQDWVRAEEVVSRTIEAHDIASFRIANASSTVLTELLGSLLETWDNPQTLYFSCHGTLTQLAFDRALTSNLSFLEFGSALSRLREDCVTLVLGCCYGLDEHSPILAHIPIQVSEVFGFTGEPLASDVASLMLGILHDQAVLYHELSSQNTSSHGAGIAIDDWDAAVQRFEAAMNSILDGFIENPSRHVRGTSGIAIRWLRRVDYNGHSVWQGRTIQLRCR